LPALALDLLQSLFEHGLCEPDAVRQAFAGLGFELLADKPVRFRCSCSHERMVGNIRLAVGDDYRELFEPDQQALEIVCEYCKSQYSVTRDELGRASTPLN